MKKFFKNNFDLLLFFFGRHCAVFGGQCSKTYLGGAEAGTELKM
jgi:hypothetical protein